MFASAGTWSAERVGAHNSVVGADQGFRAPSGDQASVRESVHEDSASARIAAGQRPQPSFRHPHGRRRRSSCRSLMRLSGLLAIDAGSPTAPACQD